MIVHSVTNVGHGCCLVQVEGIETSVGDATVRLFASGAAGALNRGELIATSSDPRAIEWLDENGRPIPDGADTSQSTAARVLCEGTAP